MNPVECLEPFDAERFLDDYWQRRPCLIRGWLAPEPLKTEALLALGETHALPMRLVIGTQSQADWDLVHGPLRADELPVSQRNWTVVVQEVDKASPSVATILEPFRRFLPDWIIDDVMISQAAGGGSVGAHVDAYDVFLVQAAGRRHWQLATDFNPATDPRFELALLEHWQPETELMAEPGDVLYLPAGIAHHGVARGDCQTWSVGLRTPAASELMFYLAEWLSLKDTDQPRLPPGRPDADLPARITPAVVTEARRIMERALQLSDSELESALGRFLTGWRLWQREGELPEHQSVNRILAEGNTIALDPAARLAVTGTGDRFQFHANGEPIACPEALGRELAATRRLTPDWLDCPEALEELIDLDAVTLDETETENP